MSTLTISIIALIVIVVGAVALFNVWQARSNRRLPRDGLQAQGKPGRQEQRPRHERLDGLVRRIGNGSDLRQAGNGGWQSGPEQNAWARQRREPTLLPDDDPAASAHEVRDSTERGGERRHAASPADPEPRWERDSFMTADDDVAAERIQAQGTRQVEQGRRLSARQVEADAGGFSRLGGPGRSESGGWDNDPQPDPDEEFGPPAFETPRFDADSLDAPESLEPLRPEDPGLRSSEASEASERPQRSAPGFENTRPFPEESLHARTDYPTHPAADDGVTPAGGGDRARRAEDADAAGISAAVPPSVYAPAEVDHVVTLIPRAPVNAERLIALTSSLRHVGSKTVRIEIDNGHGRWIPLQSGSMVGCLRCSVLLANRQGALNAVELSDFSAAMEALAGQVGARFVPPDMNEVLRQARQLDALAARLDTQVDLGVEASAPVTAQQLSSVARQLALADRGGGRFACFAEGGERLYTLMPGETSDMLTFVLDVPRTPEECDPWRSMVACATSCAQLVGGRMVDGAGRGMSVSMIETVGHQLQKRYEELSKAGLKAGSPAALRLFN